MENTVAKTLKTDGIDKVIINNLKIDPIMSNHALSREIGISEEEVKNRISKLEKLNIVVTGCRIINQHYYSGNTLTAFLGLYLSHPANYEYITRELSNIQEVNEAYFMTGSYQVLLKLIAKDHEELLQIISEKIQIIKGVYRIQSSMSMGQTIDKKVLSF